LHPIESTGNRLLLPPPFKNTLKSNSVWVFSPPHPSDSLLSGMKSKAKSISQLRAAGPQPLSGRVRLFAAA
jgi:hypothetical protein